MRACSGLTLIVMILFSSIGARSPFREQDPLMPEITTCWCDDKTQTYTLKNEHLEEYAIFTIFNKKYFFNHLLPKDEISFRNDPTQSVKGKVLAQLIEDLIKEIQKSHHQKKRFKHFKVLKNRDYNPRTHSGLIILKFKKYPFVVKLFMETPKSFVLPFSKGIEPAFMFTLGRGTSRHGSGFTRLPNLEQINKKIKADPYWSQIVDTPRKWFFYSPDCRWFEIHGKNIGTNNNIMCTVPGTYGIICDAIEEHPRERMTQSRNRKQAIKLSHFLNGAIDPHIVNFMIEKSTGKIIIIDTEHFPSLVGLDKPFVFSNYVSYYTQLSQKYLKDALFQTKKERHTAQKKPVSNFRKIIID